MMLERCDAIGNALTLQAPTTAASAPEKTIRVDGGKKVKKKRKMML